MAIFDKSETKKAYEYDAKGVYVKDIELTWMNRSPISGTWQIPAYVTTIEPVAAKDSFDRVFDGTKWSYIDADDDSKEPETVDPTIKTLKDRVAELEYEKAELKRSNEELKTQQAEMQAAIDAIVMS